MKRIFLLSTLAIIATLPVAACDICGCGVGNNYIGILPDFSARILGIRYRYNSLLTHVGVGGATTYLTTNETYQTTELWGGWNVSKNIRLMASVPYSFNERTNQGTTSKKNGLSDISITAYYQLINKKKTVFSNKLLVQSVWAGIGIKAPTGKYNPVDKQGTNENTNLFQLGTGSVDAMANAMYDVRLQDVGLNVAASYKMNTTNQYHYRYGNKSSLAAQAYYKIRVKEAATLAPNAGVQYERAAKDKDGDFDVDVSGGNLLLGTAGAEISFKKLAIGGNWQTPFSQNLGKGFVRANNRVMVHLSVAL